MEELYEFRVSEDFADRLFAPNEGQRLGSVRRIILTATDDRLQQIPLMQDVVLAETGRQLFFGWDVRRVYRDVELAAAALFLLSIRATANCAGEEFGTAYDESQACKFCHANSRQIGPLFLDPRRLPKRSDIVVTLGNEVLVRRSLGQTIQERNLTGVILRSVRIPTAGGGVEAPDWLQLEISNTNVEISAATRAGNNPFDLDPSGQYRCPRGHVLGLNLISEVTIEGSSLPNVDFCSTSQHIGVRRGLLRPRKLLLVSPRVRDVFADVDARGATFEIARLT